MLYIGVDLGTSSVKLILMESNGKVAASVTKKYDVENPYPGWSQQNPADWLSQSVAGIKELIKGHDASQIAGLGVGGQMHGLVMLDKDDNVIRPAILWNDGRTEKEVHYLNDVIGRDRISKYTANIAFAGFTAPKVLWVKENEPENYSRIAKIMLPKDYLVYMLTGQHVTDVSDASGMLLMDVEHRCWSKEMCEICGVDPEWLPELHESSDAIGKLLPKYESEFGVKNVIVAAGAGDNAAAAVGTGTVGDGRCNISLGTSGTVFISSSKFRIDDFNALHSFAHADGGYHLMGCMLSAASCGSWFMNNVLNTDDFKTEEEGMNEKLGKNTVYFLPYLMGERSPLNDVNARGVFAGMTSATTRQDMLQAVFEGVSFGLRDSVEVARKLGLEITRSKLCGGGAKDKVWRRMLANILNITLEIPTVEEGPSLGGAMLAAVACGEYPSVQAAADAIVTVKEEVHPEPELVEMYEKRYQIFKSIYPALKDIFKNMVQAEK